MQEDRGHLPQAAEAGIGHVDLRLGRRHRADQQRCRARVAPCGAVAQEQRRNGQRSGQPLRGADAQRRGDLSAAESQRLGATDRVLSSATRRLCSTFFAARRRRTGRCLIGQSPSGRACPGRIQAKTPHQRGISGPVSKNFGNSWGGQKTVATPAIRGTIRVVPFRQVARRGPGLERLRGAFLICRRRTPRNHAIYGANVAFDRFSNTIVACLREGLNTSEMLSLMSPIRMFF